MEKPPLDKIIEKLEKLDIREWKTIDDTFFTGWNFSVHIQGLVFHLARYNKNDYGFYIQNEEKSIRIEYNNQKKIINSFGEKLFKTLAEYKKKELPRQEKEFEERLNRFVSD